MRKKFEMKGVPYGSIDVERDGSLHIFLYTEELIVLSDDVESFLSTIKDVAEFRKEHRLGRDNKTRYVLQKDGSFRKMG